MRLVGVSNADKLSAYSARRRNGCLVWTAGTFASGYGCIRDAVTGKSRRAHIVAYEEMYGPVPDGQCVLHECDNKLCIEPTHLVAGSQKKNTNDAWSRGLCTPNKGERHGKAKLTEAKISQIRRSRLSATTLAAKYGVSDVCIRNARNRKTWKHLA